MATLTQKSIYASIFKFRNVKWCSQLTKIVYRFFDLGLQFFAIKPLWPSCSLFQTIHIFVWLMEISFIGFYAFQNRSVHYKSVGGVVSSLLFTVKIWAHFTLLLEIAFTPKCRRQHLLEIKDRILLTLYAMRGQYEPFRRIHHNPWNLSLQLPLILLLLQIGMFIIFLFIPLEKLYWYALLNIFAITFRILEILSLIVAINGSAELLRRSIHVIAHQNSQLIDLINVATISTNQQQHPHRHFKIYHKEQKIIVLKELHNDLNLIFQNLNDCYGWSLLIITTMYFIDFVCNSYWLLLSIFKQFVQFSNFIQNVCFVVNDFIMLSVLCWHCQKSCNSSRAIGGLISKLYRPMGNRSYNDLVSEFSLQILNQQFVVTAKDFFQLNLNLLGNIVAAIVTYLVILLQFMLSEQDKDQH